MTLLLVIWVALVCPPTAREVAAFRATAPEYLTLESSAQHLVAARAAGTAHGVDFVELLAIAHHESRYVPTTRTPETGGRESCGVMTPTPVPRCATAWLTVLGGYDHGAEHLALWRRYYRGRAALTAYAGGGGLVRACASGSSCAACGTADVFEARARLIRRALATAEGT